LHQQQQHVVTQNNKIGGSNQGDDFNSRNLLLDAQLLLDVIEFYF